MPSVVKIFRSCKDRNPVLKRIATALVLIPIVLVLILRAPVPAVAVVAAVVALLTIHEFLKLTESYGVKPLRLPTYIYGGVFFLLLALNVGNEKPLLSTAIFVYCLAFAAAIAPFLALTILMRRQDLPVVLIDCIDPDLHGLQIKHCFLITSQTPWRPRRPRSEHCRWIY